MTSAAAAASLTVDVATAHHQVSVWGEKATRSKDERTLALLTLSLLDALGDGALSHPGVVDVVARAQMEIACGWTPEWAARMEHRFSAAVSAETRLSRSSIEIFCDGCCLNNGKTGARAGYGVFVRNAATGAEIARIAERLAADQAQTNQRAELRALQHALGIAAPYIMEGNDVVIYTDSRYAMDCITKWAPAWKAAGWVKADRKPIQHLDLIKTMYERLESMGGDSVTLKHVAAHTGGSDALSVGNAVADSLANEGALRD